MKTLADLVSSPTSVFYFIPARYRSLHIDEVGRNNRISAKANSASPDKLSIEGSLHTKGLCSWLKLHSKRPRSKNMAMLGELSHRSGRAARVKSF